MQKPHRTDRRVHYPKNQFIAVKTQKTTLTYLQRQNDRDTVKQRNSQTTRRNCVSWQPFPEKSVPQDDITKNYICILLLLLLLLLLIIFLRYWIIISSHTHSSKQFAALWLVFHPLIMSHDQTWQILVVYYKKTYCNFSSALYCWNVTNILFIYHMTITAVLCLSVASVTCSVELSSQRKQSISFCPHFLSNKMCSGNM